MTIITQTTRICAAPGCEALASGGALCAGCGAEKAARSMARKRAFDKRRARDPHRKVYKTSKWTKGREAFLLAHPYCARCGGAAQEVDHIIPVRQRPDLAFAQSNWQPLCTPCHSRKTAREDSAFARATGGGSKIPPRPVGPTFQPDSLLGGNSE